VLSDDNKRAIDDKFGEAGVNAQSKSEASSSLSCLVTLHCGFYTI
jgi:DnaJ-class molecular chaperone